MYKQGKGNFANEFTKAMSTNKKNENRMSDRFTYSDFQFYQYP